MRAVQLVAWQTEPKLREVHTPRPAPGQVLVKVEAAGLCHSDLHVMTWSGEVVGWRLPCTLGHEVAGVVAEVGQGATGVREGEPVLIYGPWGCGSCRQCARGAENLCPNLVGACGLGYDGGLADFVVVPSSRYLVTRGELDALHSAPLSDAALTPYHALIPHLWRLVPGSTVIVIGVGGLGHVAIQLVRALSPAKIVGIDTRQQARALAQANGAHTVLDPSELTEQQAREEIGRDGAALVLDFVGSDQSVRLGIALIENGGHVSIIGLGGWCFS